MMQTLAEAWAERSADPWAKKALKLAGGSPGTPLAEAARQALADSQSGADPALLVPVAAAALHSVLHQGYRKYEEVRASLAEHDELGCPTEQQYFLEEGSQDFTRHGWPTLNFEAQQVCCGIFPTPEKCPAICHAWQPPGFYKPWCTRR